MKMKKHLTLVVSCLFIIGLMAFMPGKRYQEPWPVPDAYKNKVNPLKGNAESVATGKTLYNQHCKSCHGAKGKGDGPKAAQLDTECGDFTKASFHAQTDGSLFYKVYQGRKDMPSYKTKIPDADDIWAVVNFMRTLK
jgi:mono/diheme cytochrome c family protein